MKELPTQRAALSFVHAEHRTSPGIARFLTGGILPLADERAKGFTCFAFDGEYAKAVIESANSEKIGIRRTRLCIERGPMLKEPRKQFSVAPFWRRIQDGAHLGRDTARFQP
jgi:hypothetical protein